MNLNREDYVLPMESYFHLCDQAFFSTQNKLNIIGIFDRIISPTFPALHARPVYAAARFRTPPGKDTELKIRMTPIAGGESVNVLRFVTPTPPKEEYSVVAFQLDALPFNAPGRYILEMLVNDVPAISTYLDVSTS